MAANKKMEEGLEHVRLAEKSLKTSFLKWRPDYDIAADEYTKAATAFRAAKAYDQAKDSLLKACEQNKQNRSLFHAAKNLDQAVSVCKEMGDLKDVAQLAERACRLYQQHGSADSGATSLERAAKILEQQHPQDALSLYQKAADVVVLDSNTRQAAEYMSKVARILVKLRMYDQAADALCREISLHQELSSIGLIGRLTVALVLVQLARGDSVAAEKAFKEWGNCCEPEEVQTLETLLTAFDEEDPDMAKQALKSSFIKNMDIEYARLARDLPLPEGISSAPKSVVEKNDVPSGTVPVDSEREQDSTFDSRKPGKVEDEDDEYAGGLC